MHHFDFGRVRRPLLLLGLLTLLTPLTAQAHVKWFSDFTFADPPKTLGEVITPLFVGLVLLSMAVIAVLVYLDKRIDQAGWYQRIVSWFSARREHALTVMRVGAGAALLLSWQADRLLAPDLALPAAWVGWLQFAAVLLLLLPRTTPLAGVVILILYAIAVVTYGTFYMLDYFAYVGVAVYLMVSQARDASLRGLRLPALYFAVGFSLCWLALEKLVYPQWGLYVIQQNPGLALGLDPRFFLTATAFVEFSLGFLVIMGVLERPLSVIITLVFFSTTLVFGRVEIVGHTILHAALIVFLLEGPGTLYQAPIALFRRSASRVAFAAVAFLVLLGLLLLPYTSIAQLEYQQTAADQPIESASLIEEAGLP